MYISIICCAHPRVSCPRSAGMPKAEWTEQALLSGFGMLQFPTWEVSPVRMLHAGVPLQQPPTQRVPLLPPWEASSSFMGQPVQMGA